MSCYNKVGGVISPLVLAMFARPHLKTLQPLQPCRQGALFTKALPHSSNNPVFIHMTRSGEA